MVIKSRPTRLFVGCSDRLAFRDTFPKHGICLLRGLGGRLAA